MAKITLAVVVYSFVLVLGIYADEYAYSGPDDHAQVVHKPKGCIHLPGYMDSSDAGKEWAENRQYTMKCEDGIRSFVATCRNRAWVFDQNYCKGPLPSGGLFSKLFGPKQIGYDRPPPRPHHQPDVKPVDLGYHNGDKISTGSPVLDGLVDSLQNLFKPFTATKDSQQIDVEHDLYGGFNNAFNNMFNFGGDQRDDYTACSYDSNHIKPQDSGRTYGHGYNYKAVCKQHYDRYYYATCKNGQWIFDEGPCTNQHYTNNPFGNIFTFDADFSGLFSGFNDLFGNLFNSGPSTGGDYNECAYDPRHMKGDYSSGTYNHGYQYRAVCEGYTDRYFYIMCNDGQWVYEETTCSSPGPHGSSFFDNMSSALRDLFGPFLGTGEHHGDYSSCTYNPVHIRPDDGGKTFRHGHQYTSTCEQYPGRHYHGICNDGRWVFDDTHCSEDKSYSEGGSFMEDFASSFNNIFKPLTGGYHNTQRGSYSNCQYKPTHFAPEDQVKTFYHGFSYRAVCKGYTDRYYYGKCESGQWTFDEAACSSPQPQTGNGLSGLFDNFASTFDNLFSPLTGSQGNRCAYSPMHHGSGDSGKTFSHGYSFNAMCKGYTNRYYNVRCNDGQWMYDERHCSTSVVHPL
ncbi:uncharacterized protein LOC120339742 [Styela clava]